MNETTTDIYWKMEQLREQIKKLETRIKKLEDFIDNIDEGD